MPSCTNTFCAPYHTEVNRNRIDDFQSKIEAAVVSRNVQTKSNWNGVPPTCMLLNSLHQITHQITDLHAHVKIRCVSGIVCTRYMLSCFVNSSAFLLVYSTAFVAPVNNKKYRELNLAEFCAFASDDTFCGAEEWCLFIATAWHVS